MKLQEVAAALKIEFKGDGNLEIAGLKDLMHLLNHEEPFANFLYFVEAAKLIKKHPQLLDHGIILTTRTLAVQFKNALFADDDKIRLVFIELLNLFAPKRVFTGKIHERASIASSAILGNSVTIMANSVIADHVKIGNNCVIYPNVSIDEHAEIGEGTVLHPGVVIGAHCKIGKHCILFGNAVIGADGFGYHDQEGSRYKVPQIGNVVIGNFVEIGACSTIDRATINSTTIGDFTKIDNQVQIGHNCQVGAYVYIAGNAGISGSVIIEDHVTIAGQAGVADHVRIGAGAIIMALTGINTDIEKKSIVFGIPARPIKEFARINGAVPHLPELLKRVRALEEKSE